MTDSTPHYMKIALQEARAAFKAGEIPVGAIIVERATGKIIATAHNRCEQDCDPTAHAEVLVIRQATAYLKEQRLEGCDLYVTLEPCTLCATAISFARISRVYFGAYDPKGGGVEHGARFYTQPTCHHTPDVYGGIDEAECAGLMKEFFKEKR